MKQLSHIGLDVHKDTIAVAVLRPDAFEVDERTIPNTPEAIRRLLRPYADPSSLRVCYEAGPTGYDTYRLITSLGHTCAVIAPSLIPRRAGVRVKTDRTDARNLVRLFRAGELTCVRVPSPAEEAARDLIRVREEVKATSRRSAAGEAGRLQQLVRPPRQAHRSAQRIHAAGWVHRSWRWPRQ